MVDTTYRLEALGMQKAFGGVRALIDGNLRLRSGSVHALFGVNGAGKSTLVKILTGVQGADAGEIRIAGETVQFRSPADAKAAGVAVVFQDPPLFPHLSVAENLVAGAYPRLRGRLVDSRRCRSEALEVLQKLQIPLLPEQLVEGLSVAEREFVAIARALLQDSQVLILDEPTAALTPEETRRLFSVLREYRARGGAVLFITHRIDEALELADDATIFRSGRTVASCPIRELSHHEIVENMLGRALDDELERYGGVATPDSSRVVFAVKDLNVAGQPGNVSLALHTGEVVALAGLVGAGRTEVLEGIVGLRRVNGGRVWMDDIALRRRTPRRMADLGVVLVPEDRDADGLVPGFSVAENIALGSQRKLARGGLLRPKAERKLAQAQAETLGIVAPGVDTDVASLSGGNRQKVVLGKWLALNPRVLLLDEPTKGVDVGAKLEIHNLIRDLARSRGLAVLMVTSDFTEVCALADRALVMKAGEIVGELSGGAITEGNVLALATSARAACPPIKPGDDAVLAHPIAASETGEVQ